MCILNMLQVLSSTIADALAFYGKPETTGTERFVRLIDAFFDCLNVRSPKEYMHKRKPNLAPYTNVADIRFGDYIPLLSMDRLAEELFLRQMMTSQARGVAILL